ncbi:MAG: solute:Na+ symporter, family [Solirubrobacteraceae bacterium]|jgi:SSS family solute:Na+ symporter|nr:solute:Na+ symporter, family [Solirubrobacteraceae bacterium]
MIVPAVKVAHDTNATALVIFVVLFGLVTVLGFFAARWRSAKLDHLDEWGLGGRRFGTWITWFLLGGDLYTAYTFIAVPALVFGVGALGFFALPYTIIMYPLVFMVLPRMWTVCRAHGYVTPADFVRGRYRSKPLALVVALTGLLATMPYIALQLVGMQVVLGALGVEGDWPLVIAFVILAAYTYQSGLRAPALIAIVKDSLIYLTIIVAVIYIPSKIGGFGAMFDAAEKALPKHTPKPGALIPAGADAHIAYATLAFGSALALFLYPHAITAVLSAKSAQTIRRNTALLPAYTFLLGLIALLGFMAIARGIEPSNPNFAVPDLFLDVFPSWFVGVAFAAIAIGALVPAAVMSIAAANLFTRNIYKEYLRPHASHADEARTAKIVSLVVKLGALVIIVTLPTKYAIELQLLGGVWILQTLPAIVVGLYSRWLHRWALVAGWAVGMTVGTLMAASQDFAPAYPLELFGTKINAYTGVFALAANLIVTVLLTLVLRGAAGVRDDGDETRPQDYDELAEDTEYPPAGASSARVPAPAA